MTLAKVNKISAIITAVAIPLSTVCFFLQEADYTFRWNLVPPSWEAILRLCVTALIGIAFGSCFLTISLSLFQMSEHK